MRGFSLVELAVTLLVTGIVAMGVWRLVPLMLGGTGALDTQRVADVRQSLRGHALSQRRLPCPDTTGNGQENCGGGDQGGLPWRSLGIAPPAGVVRYGVSADLTGAAGSSLAFCEGLLAGGGIDVGNGASRTPAAFVVAKPGSDNVFDRPAGGGFRLPGESGGQQDDTVYAEGAGELAATLGCPGRLARRNAAREAAEAGETLATTAGLYEGFRETTLSVRQGNADGARVLRELTIGAQAVTVAGEAIGITGGALHPALRGWQAVIFGAQVTLSSIRLAETNARVVVADLNVNPNVLAADNAVLRRDNARAAADRADTLEDNEEKRADTEDQRGLLP